RNLTLLNLAALSSGRALIRIVETPNGPNTEVDLAMAVSELVGQAYLFDAKNPAAAVEASVMNAAGQEMNPTPEPKKNDARACVTPDPRRSFTLETIGRAGIAGTQGPRLTLGGGIGIQRLFTKNLFMGGGLQLIAGPFEDRDAQQIENLSLAPYLGGGILRPFGRISMGGGLFISLPWQQTTITLPTTGTHLYRDWNMRVAIRFIIQIPLGRSLALSLSPDVGLWLNQKRYFAISSNRDIVRNPRLDVGLIIALVLNN
ncbi:MAG: hypothetical protein JXX14_21000, partial [Deltaproteobacteria bacterium]|nr:hypothetical protein [Deltaproteobacteria bacterium]